MTDAAFRRAILSGYPDRVAQRREPGSPNVRLASGTGATIAPESGVRDGRFLVAIEVMKGLDENKIRIASRVEREWLQATAIETIHRFDADSGTVHAALVERYDALVLSETPTSVDPEEAANLLTSAWLERGPREDDLVVTRRLQFAGRTVNLAAAVHRAAYGIRSLDDIRLVRGIDPDVVRALGREAPETLPVPSGRAVKLEYRDDGSVAASVKLQELFGLAETPRIGARREPVLLALLAPNGRPVQMTRDLRSFWERTYPEVRKELRGRYPRHPWPEDPWNATPTFRKSRTTCRRRV